MPPFPKKKKRPKTYILKVNHFLRLNMDNTELVNSCLVCLLCKFHSIACGMRPGSLIVAVVSLWGTGPGLQFRRFCVQLAKILHWLHTQHYRILPVPTNISCYARLSITFTCRGGARLCLCSRDFIQKTKYA